mmetsp:Transcript_6990/g.20463  ORF Transcript_6990/g.20463 Transcript_6990/m.20463 type:complete len:178 (+) Transcript_6990:620-1153(+)
MKPQKCRSDTLPLPSSMTGGDGATPQRASPTLNTPFLVPPNTYIETKYACVSRFRRVLTCGVASSGGAHCGTVQAAEEVARAETAALNPSKDHKHKKDKKDDKHKRDNKRDKDKRKHKKDKGKDKKHPKSKSKKHKHDSSSSNSSSDDSSPRKRKRGDSSDTSSDSSGARKHKKKHR